MESSSSKGKRIPKGKRLPAKPLKPLKPKKAPHGKEKEVDEGMFISLLCFSVVVLLYVFLCFKCKFAALIGQNFPDLYYSPNRAPGSQGVNYFVLV